MIGNVDEWTATTDDEGRVVVLGGDWGVGVPRRVSEYVLYDANLRTRRLGFRCARDSEAACSTP